MDSSWSREFLLRRIDRCYLIAAATRAPEKRQAHLDLARHYRKVLGNTAAVRPCSRDQLVSSAS